MIGASKQYVEGELQKTYNDLFDAGTVFASSQGLRYQYHLALTRSASSSRRAPIDNQLLTPTNSEREVAASDDRRHDRQYRENS